MLSKQHLRQLAKEHRKQLTSSQRAIYSQTITKLIFTLPLFQNSHRIAAYYPRPTEVTTLPLLHQAQALNKVSYLPVINFENKCLEFFEYNPDTPLCENRFKILEPVRNKQTFIPTPTLDLVFLPLLGFDQQGNRLGLGKGYYDRTFAFLQGATHPMPQLIGLAFSCQVLPTIPRDPWDIALHGIVTEQGFLSFR